MLLNTLSRILKQKPRTKPCETPLLIAHRGGPDYDTNKYKRKKPLEYKIWESSKSAYKRALQNGAKAIEMDVQLTKDNEIIILHDYTLNRTTNAKGLVRNYTINELETNVFTNQEYNETLPTLKWMFEEFKDNDNLYIIEAKNIKDKTKIDIFARRLAELINQYKAEKRCQIISFYPKVLKAISRYLPKISKALLVSTKHYLSSLLKRFAFLYGVDTISFNYDGVNKRIVEQCRESGFKVAVWTVNDEEELMRMKGLKVDFITSDFFYSPQNNTETQ